MCELGACALVSHSGGSWVFVVVEDIVVVEDKVCVNSVPMPW